MEVSLDTFNMHEIVVSPASTCPRLSDVGGSSDLSSESQLLACSDDSVIGK